MSDDTSSEDSSSEEPVPIQSEDNAVNAVEGVVESDSKQSENNTATGAEEATDAEKDKSDQQEHHEGGEHHHGKHHHHGEHHQGEHGEHHHHKHHHHKSEEPAIEVKATSENEKAASKIQAIQRGNESRKKLELKKVFKRAMVKLQAQHRGTWTRNNFQAACDKLVQDEVNHQEATNIHDIAEKAALNESMSIVQSAKKHAFSSEKAEMQKAAAVAKATKEWRDAQDNLLKTKEAGPDSAAWKLLEAKKKKRAKAVADYEIAKQETSRSKRESKVVKEAHESWHNDDFPEETNKLLLSCAKEHVVAKQAAKKADDAVKESVIVAREKKAAAAKTRRALKRAVETKGPMATEQIAHLIEQDEASQKAAKDARVALQHAKTKSKRYSFVESEALSKLDRVRATAAETKISNLAQEHSKLAEAEIAAHKAKDDAVAEAKKKKEHAAVLISKATAAKRSLKKGGDGDMTTANLKDTEAKAAEAAKEAAEAKAIADELTEVHHDAKFKSDTIISNVHRRMHRPHVHPGGVSRDGAYVEVCIFSATELPNMNDIDIDPHRTDRHSKVERKRTTDACCLTYLTNQTSNVPEKFDYIKAYVGADRWGKTKIMKDTLKPIWKQYFLLRIKRQIVHVHPGDGTNIKKPVLHVHLFDYDEGSPDESLHSTPNLIGSVEINIEGKQSSLREYEVDQKPGNMFHARFQN